MPATFTIPLINVIPGQVITALLWNNEYGNLYDNFIPAGMDDYSSNDTQMQTATDPFPGGATSRPTSLQGEIERLRFALAGITGETYWYNDPDVDISTFKTRFDAHTHDGTSNQGPQIAAGGLASNAVTTAKILDSNVTTAKINDLAVTNAKINDVATSKLSGTIGTSQIADSAITNAKVSDVAASKITSTLSTSQIGDAQVTYAKLASDVTDKLSPKTIQRSSGNITFSGEVGAKTANVTISSVTTSKSYVILNGHSGAFSSGGVVNPVGASAQLTSATNVQITVSNESGSNGTGTITVYFTVVEWN